MSGSSSTPGAAGGMNVKRIERFTKQTIEVRIVDGFGPEQGEQAEPVIGAPELYVEPRDRMNLRAGWACEYEAGL